MMHNIMQRPTWIEIDLEALKHNLHAIKNLVGQQVRIMGIVKANAYGNGAYKISKVLLNNGVEMLGVAILEEGIQLRDKGITAPLLLLGGFFKEQIDTIIRYNLTPTVYDLKLAELLSERALQLKQTVNVHIYVDTGMGGIGIRRHDAVKFVQSVNNMKNLFIEGIYTHCSSSDEEDSAYTHLQIKRFREILTELGENNIYVPLQHMANSSAILKHPESHFTMVRPGLSLYGLCPNDKEFKKIPLRPVMSLKTKIIHIKNMDSGEFVGYGRAHKITKPASIATLPVGYDDGYNRLLSNRGKVIVKNNIVPLVGRICMDMCFIDVSDIPNVSVGDEVVLYGKQGDKSITIESIASQLQTIPYEVICNISNRVPRHYINV